jgi:hypothetical protein
MPTTTTVTTTYVGFDQKKYVQASVLSGSTLANGLVTVLPNVNFKTRLGLFGGSGAIQDASCDFNPQGTITLSDVILTVKEFELARKVCKKDFLSTWEGEGWDINGALPQAVAEQMTLFLGKQVAKNVESYMWEGTNAANSFAGFATLASLAATLPAAQEVAGAAVTPLNVLAELGKIVDAIPESLIGNPDLAIYVSPVIYRAYARVLSTSGVGASGVNGNVTQWFSWDNALTFDGIPVLLASGLTGSKAICTLKSNLFFGTSLESDLSEVRVIDQGPIDGSQNVNVIIRFTAGAQIATYADVVTYGIVNAAN